MPLRRSAATLAALLLPLGVAASACSQQDDPTEAELQEDVAEELRERDDDLTADQADCYAGLLVDELGVDAVMDLDYSDEEPDAEVAEGIAAAAAEARTACDLATAPG